LLAFAVNYTTFWCTNVNSPLTTSVTGQAKNILTTFAGILAFGLASTPMLVWGLTLGLLGSAYYSYVKFDEQARDKPAASAALAAAADVKLERRK